MDNSDLTDRQIQILKYVIEEYIETAEPVGSKILESKYQLGVSPATIRNEMVKLIEKGYLKQPHTSAGRVPTSIALKFYINRLMKPKNLGVSEEVAVKEKVWDVRHELSKLLKEATLALADSTNTLAIATTNNHDIYYSGAGNILEMQEFANLALAHSVFEMLDHADWWKKAFDKSLGFNDPFYVILGTDWGEETLDECGYIFSTFDVGQGLKGSIGVVGPLRLNYSYIIPTVEYLSNLISEIARR
jgi:heat-inducible transcriptional repressor